jgi:hypothetical protein
MVAVMLWISGIGPFIVHSSEAGLFPPEAFN